MQPAATALATTPDVDSPAIPALTKAGQAALDAARALGRNAAAPATLRAYKADWTAWFKARLHVELGGAGLTHAGRMMAP